MKYLTTIFVICLAFLFSLHKPVSSQFVSPRLYGGAPVTYYSGGDSDDDLGILLAILLLAARNRGGCGGGCCNYCNGCCGNKARTVPVPFPIPIPTNNPIIQQYEDDYCDERPYYKPRKVKDDPAQVINFVTDNDDNSDSTSNVKNAPKTISGSTSNSGSRSSATSKNKNEDIKKVNNAGSNHDNNHAVNSGNNNGKDSDKNTGKKADSQDKPDKKVER